MTTVIRPTARRAVASDRGPGSSPRPAARSYGRRTRTPTLQPTAGTRKINASVLRRTVLPLGASRKAAGCAHAQTLVFSQNKCNLAKQGDVRRLADSLFMPIAQELVNEGKLTAAGSAYHAWGDEWNVVIWYRASDLNAFSAGFDELIRRVNQRHPTFFDQLGSWCSEHKDSMYVEGRMTTACRRGRAAAGVIRGHEWHRHSRPMIGVEATNSDLDLHYTLALASSTEGA